MGLTIYYKGSLNNSNLIEPFIEEIKDIAKDMDWEYNLLDNDLEKPNTAQIVDGNIIGHISLKGISLNIHPNSETLSFDFDKDGNLRNLISMCFGEDIHLDQSSLFIKTQFAPVEVHITIVKLLKYIKSKYISNLEVQDEGDYWNSGNKEILKQRLDFLNEKIDEVGNIISNIKLSSDDTVESIAAKIEQVLKKYKK